jgi:hypothetical protein
MNCRTIIPAKGLVAPNASLSNMAAVPQNNVVRSRKTMSLMLGTPAKLFSFH